MVDYLLLLYCEVFLLFCQGMEKGAEKEKERAEKKKSPEQYKKTLQTVRILHLPLWLRLGMLLQWCAL